MQDQRRARISPIGDNQPPALPDDLPPAPDLAGVPPHILHSGTIETLIGQNDDLMARLKVNIRRNAVLEQQIMQHEKSSEDLARANTSLLAQLQTVKEKDAILRDKAGRAESTQVAFKDQLEQYRARVKNLEAERLVLKRSERYRDRINRWVHPLVKLLRSQLQNERKTVFAKEAQASDLRARISEAAEHAIALERKFSRDQARLVEQYEAQKKPLISELEQLRLTNKTLREKSVVIDQAIKNEAQSRNQIVHLEREHETLKMEFSRQQNYLKTVTIECEQRSAQYDKAKDQVSHIQLLWAEAQKRLEIARTQNDTLNLINQELGRQNAELRLALTPIVGASLEAPNEINNNLADELTVERIDERIDERIESAADAVSGHAPLARPPAPLPEAPGNDLSC